VADLDVLYIRKPAQKRARQIARTLHVEEASLPEMTALTVAQLIPVCGFETLAESLTIPPINYRNLTGACSPQWHFRWRT